MVFLDFTRGLKIGSKSAHNNVITQIDLTTQASNIFLTVKSPLIALNETLLNLFSKYCHDLWIKRNNFSCDRFMNLICLPKHD